MGRRLDPLLSAICAYKKGWDDFNALAEAAPTEKHWDEYEAATFGPHLTSLEKWQGPAKTREGAAEALRLAMDEERGIFNSPAGDSLMRAALGYLERQAA